MTLGAVVGRSLGDAVGQYVGLVLGRTVGQRDGKLEGLSVDCVGRSLGRIEGGGEGSQAVTRGGEGRGVGALVGSTLSTKGAAVILVSKTRGALAGTLMVGATVTDVGGVITSGYQLRHRSAEVRWAESKQRHDEPLESHLPIQLQY